MEFNTSDKPNTTAIENQGANLSAKVLSEIKDGKIDCSVPAIKTDACLPDVKIDGLSNDRGDTGKPNKEKEVNEDRTPCQESDKEHSGESEIDKTPDTNTDKDPDMDTDKDPDMDTDKDPDMDTDKEPDSCTGKEFILKPGEDVVNKRSIPGNPSE